MRYLEAVKLWNASRPEGMYCTPRKGSSEYEEVKAILAKHNPPKPPKKSETRVAAPKAVSAQPTPKMEAPKARPAREVLAEAKKKLDIAKRLKQATAKKRIEKALKGAIAKRRAGKDTKKRQVVDLLLRTQPYTRKELFDEDPYAIDSGAMASVIELLLANRVEGQARLTEEQFNVLKPFYEANRDMEPIVTVPDDFKDYEALLKEEEEAAKAKAELAKREAAFAKRQEGAKQMKEMIAKQAEAAKRDRMAPGAQMARFLGAANIHMMGAEEEDRPTLEQIRAEQAEKKRRETPEFMKQQAEQQRRKIEAEIAYNLKEAEKTAAKAKSPIPSLVGKTKAELSELLASMSIRGRTLLKTPEAMRAKLEETYAEGKKATAESARMQMERAKEMERRLAFMDEMLTLSVPELEYRMEKFMSDYRKRQDETAEFKARVKRMAAQGISAEQINAEIAKHNEEMTKINRIGQFPYNAMKAAKEFKETGKLVYPNSITF